MSLVFTLTTSGFCKYKNDRHQLTGSIEKNKPLQHSGKNRLQAVFVTEHEK